MCKYNVLKNKYLIPQILTHTVITSAGINFLKLLNC